MNWCVWRCEKYAYVVLIEGLAGNSSRGSYFVYARKARPGVLKTFLYFSLKWALGKIATRGVLKAARSETCCQHG